MSNVPEDLRYTANHEWARLEGDGTVKIGITDHAQKQLGDLVFVELPNGGDRLAADDACGSLESVKAVAELYCPVSGTVIARNEELNDAPESINDNPYGAWLFTIRPDSAADFERLLDAAAYTRVLTEEE
ncbi:MAG: glycine cleavage system protein GcvH [Methylococcaceae bacterium]|nr:glycine cleavage system protein GcvH [Methylococcaceae bacterium]MCI0667779.1 glycine cleavage system protein GcvH [Methylococcaceae bacterium]MCI0732900.1 glycine cleavage system protein GcvH [Methylococcaceae bacterium]